MTTPDRISRGRPLTPQEAARYRDIRAQIEAEKPSIFARRDAQVQAEREPGFSGDLRRAITTACRPSHELAAELGIDVRLLEDFRVGEATLPSDVIDRLVATLGLRLTAEISG
jgi:ribosome-binding protein aMBF1 (putative translation factor)